MERFAFRPNRYHVTWDERVIYRRPRLPLASADRPSPRLFLNTTVGRLVQVVERSDPASVAETSRLRDRGAAVEEQARRAQREASEARQQVGRELAVNQVKCCAHRYSCTKRGAKIHG